MGPTEYISEFIHDTTYASLPQKVVDTARTAITDFIGVALAGAGEPINALLHEYARDVGGNEQATVIGSGYRTSAGMAAMLNGAIGHALDFDDWSMAVHGHPSVFLVPPLMALAEQYGFSGKDIITAYVAGYECVALIPFTVTLRHFDQGWHPTGTLGTFGATAACCKLLGLSVEETNRAIGIGCSMAAGIRCNNGTMTKPLHAGNAAANGIKAAKLAKLGYTSAKNIIEITRGFLYSFGYTGELDWDAILAPVGKEFQLVGNEGLNIKPYPCCGGNAFAIDAVKLLKKRHNFDLKDIKEIELWVNTIAHLPLIYHNPKKGLEGKFSLEYNTARALVDGNVGLSDFTDERVNDPAVRALMSKMIWTVKYGDPGEGKADAFDPKGVLIRMNDGTEYFEEVFIHMGMPQNPMPKDEFEKKFHDCASISLPKNKIAACYDMLSRFEELETVDGLINMLH